jgi:hypothetical protein
MKKKYITIILIVSTLLLCGILFFALNREENTTELIQSSNIEYVDQDTGEVVSEKPNTTPETEGSYDTIVLGLSTLGNYGSMGLSPNQLPAFKKDLIEKALPSLGSYDSTVKITDIAFNTDTLRLQSNLIYKENTDPVAILYDVRNSTVFSYTIIKDNDVLYSSDSIITTEVVPH